jgi:hypothetical protein
MAAGGEHACCAHRERTAAKSRCARSRPARSFHPLRLRLSLDIGTHTCKVLTAATCGVASKQYRAFDQWNPRLRSLTSVRAHLVRCRVNACKVVTACKSMVVTRLMSRADRHTDIGAHTGHGSERYLSIMEVLYIAQLSGTIGEGNNCWQSA